MTKPVKRRKPRAAATGRAATNQRATPPEPPVLVFDESILADLRDLLLPADFAKIVRQALETLPTALSDLHRAWKSGDLEETGRHAHKLAGLAGNFGGAALMEAARQVENVCRKGSARQLARLIGTVDGLLKPTVDALRQHAALPAT